MIKREFPKETMQELVCTSTGEEYEGLKVIRKEIQDTTRWSIISEIIFQDIETGKLYMSDYSEGATEQQYESAYEYDEDMIECTEVESFEKTIISYRPVIKD